MELHKYNGCGNDFILVDYDEATNYSQLAKKLCAVDFFDTDGLIAVKTNPLEMIYYNKDGSQAPMCGNGIRCFARYVKDQQLIEELDFQVKTLAGAIDVTIVMQEPFYCRVRMGEPDYTPSKLAVEQARPIIQQKIWIEDRLLEITSVFMGTIHTVVFVEDAVAELTQMTGEKLCHHPLFKEQTNVNFVQQVNDSELIVRTYERGVGWTLACGTGCCAAYVVAKDHGYLSKENATVHLEQGDLIISGEKTITMAGPASYEWQKNWRNEDD
ncbi:diaminopimelate epimerase [Enterococcus sp. 10A9_DIV0425]|uniref:Diaminopimelate epimerase n=1 Tax=Candidatus Enterococcus wittei TaxID=1987383 RepID=A0A242K1F2_9ENTE|nr:diaminopimelate epimerase [Enterococcus sp. 10A9_DIV0425]OTP11292.1 diaminopimelate epimerase [Enterococcus sp. 10A9_DIV0425]THE11423.1 diaminopimelate epimerase [Enterococcus hirae]